jgi:hypothetical protein
MPGPVGKRDADRRRRNKPAIATNTVEMAGEIKIPRLPPNVHRIAKEWWQSLKISGQSKYFEPSDWAAALFIVHELDRHLRNHRPSPEWLKAIWTAMNDLLTTEAARRRVRMEVERNKPDTDEDDEGEYASVARLDDYRAL